MVHNGHLRRLNRLLFMEVILMSKTQFHRNINSGSWSFIPPGKKTQSCNHASLTGVVFKHPTPTNKQFLACINGTGNRKVFAWSKADTIDTSAPTICPADFAGWYRVMFNPKAGDRTFHIRVGTTKHTINRADRVIALDDGKTMYASGVSYSPESLPELSPETLKELSRA